MAFKSIHLDLHDCSPDLIGNDRQKSNANIRKYHQDLNFLLDKAGSPISTFLFGGTPEVYGYSSIGLGNGFVADGHYADETNRVFLDVLVDQEFVSPEIEALARIAFRAKRESPGFRQFLRVNSGRVDSEIPKERYDSEQAWGLSTHLDLDATRNLSLKMVGELIHDFVPRLIAAIPYKDPQFFLFGDNYSFAQLVDNSAIYGIVQGKRIYLDVFSCKWYSGKVLADFLVDFFSAEKYTGIPMLRE